MVGVGESIADLSKLTSCHYKQNHHLQHLGSFKEQNGNSALSRVEVATLIQEEMLHRGAKLHAQDLVTLP
jgi:hypothetical protein